MTGGTPPSHDWAMELVGTIAVQNTLGEGILWDGTAAWWTDIEERRLYRYDWAKRHLESFVTPERLGSFGFVANGERLIAAFESGFAFYEPRSGAVRWLERVGRPGIRLNDGRVDRKGRFWAGTMAEDKSLSGQAKLYCVDGTGRADVRETGITTSNAICWSPDGATFYFADSPARTMWRYAFSADGHLSDRHVFARTSGEAEPDGATVDSQGFVWNAHWSGGCIVRYAPDGRIDRVLELPVSRPTCVAFGGPLLNLLFVTTARHKLSAQALASQPHAGDVLIYETDVTGLPEPRFVPAGREAAAEA